MLTSYLLCVRIFHNISAPRDTLIFALLLSKKLRLDWRRITLRKSHLLGTVCALVLFAMSSSANAAIVASDDTSITGTVQSYDQALAVSPTSFSGVALPLDGLGGSGQTKTDGNFNFIIKDTSSEGSHTDSHISLWLFLMVAAVFGTLSEIFQSIR